MLSDQLQQLLTAYVDGELTNRQRKAVMRLLRRSPEARNQLRKLQEDARRLRALPRHHLDSEFTARVMRAVRQQRAEANRRRATREAVFPLWTGVAAAAAVLLAVGLGSYFYFAQPGLDDAPDSRMAYTTPTPVDPPPPPKDGSREEGSTQVVQLPVKPAEAPNQSPRPEQLPMPEIAANDKPKDPVNPDGIIASETPQPDMEMFKPAVVKPPFYLLEEVRKLQVDRLVKGFGPETALRIELPCFDTAKGFRRLQDALKDVAVALAVDAAAQNRLSKPRLRSNYVLFLEDLTADELARVLTRVGSDDKKAAQARPKPDGQFGTMVVNRLSDADRKELSDVLRVDPRVLQAGAGKGKGAERLALAVTYNPERPKANSPEVKRYLDNRRPARAGALQVLLVLRETPR
jgi:hypothetical protein